MEPLRLNELIKLLPKPSFQHGPTLTPGHNGLSDLVAFLKVNPDPQKLKISCEKDIERMQNFKDVPDKDVRSIRVPTLILIGDKNVTKPEHAVELNHMIQNSRLIILPGAHGKFLGELLTGKEKSHAPELTASFIEEFLNQ